MTDQRKYEELNGKYLRDAEELMARGDHVQASEKYWGAAAEKVKSVAEARHWRHSSHRDLRGVISRLFRETDDREFLELFSIAESLHANFYEDFMQPEDVRAYSESIRRLIQKLEQFAN